jgi:hypothetical protein
MSRCVRSKTASRRLLTLREMLASEEFRRLVEPLTREQVIERMERIREQLRKLKSRRQDERISYTSESYDLLV